MIIKALTWPLRWLARRVGPRKVMALLLLLIALGSTAGNLAGTASGPNIGLALTVTLTGALVGWGIAALPLRDWIAAALTSALGVGGTLTQVGRLNDELAAALRTWAILAWQAFRWSRDDPTPDWAPALLALTELWASLNTLLARTRTWALSLVEGQPISDPIAEALSWSLALWLVSAWGGWAMRRNRPLPALLPGGALLAAVLSHTGEGRLALLILLGATFLLLACVGYDLQASRWQESGIPAADLGYEVATTTILLSLLLVTAAAVSPSISIRKAVAYVQELSRRWASDAETVGEPSDIEQWSPPTQGYIFRDWRSPGLPRKHLLGSGPELSEEMVMFISTGDAPPRLSGLRTQHTPRYYWRSHTYDRYTRYGWLTGRTETVEYAAGEPTITTTLPTQKTLQQEVRVLRDLGGLLHAAGAPVTTDQDYTVAWRSHDDIFGAVGEESRYKITSLVTRASEGQLRAADTDYAEWIKKRYLALPNTVPARVSNLALDLTATEPTPYDRARAIETYLRGFPYTLDVPEPPQGRDVTDYFLFDLQRGYCDYYATAMVVMARAAGIPSRLAVGYATGSYNSFEALYAVTEADAHAWVEVYFPGYGWVEFEPTAGRPPIERPGMTASHTPSTRPETEEEPSSTLAGRYRLSRNCWLGLLAGLALIGLGAAGLLTIEGWRLRRLRPAAATAALYKRLRRHGRRLRAPMKAGDTAYEFASSLTERMAELAHESRWDRMRSPAIEETRQVIELYVRASYCSHPPKREDQMRAIRLWQKLRWRLWMARARLRWKLGRSRPKS